LSVYIKESELPEKACVIWLHGLGADASDMVGLAEQLPLGHIGLRHVFIDAPVRPVTLNGGMPMPAWYDISGMKLTDREDSVGIRQSQQVITDVIKTQMKEGFQSTDIFLAGFSQGGAMALYTALELKEPLAGVIALSAYIPLRQSIQVTQPRSTPLFMAGGRFDPIVLPEWTRASAEWLEEQGFNKLSWHEYDMEHSVCMEEIKDIASWLKQHLVGEV